MLRNLICVFYQPAISFAGIPINRAPISPRHVAI